MFPSISVEWRADHTNMTPRHVGLNKRSPGGETVETRSLSSVAVSTGLVVLVLVSDVVSKIFFFDILQLFCHESRKHIENTTLYLRSHRIGRKFLQTMLTLSEGIFNMQWTTLFFFSG
jgi:hypothetical protein